MKKLKFIPISLILILCMVIYGQTTPVGGGKKYVYLVRASHTPEQCLKTITEIKDKSDDLLSKFEFGCMSGDHTAYAFLEGRSESEVRQMLPREVLSTAKISRVDKFTPDQIDKIHKDKMKTEARK